MYKMYTNPGNSLFIFFIESHNRKWLVYNYVRTFTSIQSTNSSISCFKNSLSVNYRRASMGLFCDWFPFVTNSGQAATCSHQTYAFLSNCFEGFEVLASPPLWYFVREDTTDVGPLYVYPILKGKTQPGRCCFTRSADKNGKKPSHPLPVPAEIRSPWLLSVCCLPKNYFDVIPEPLVWWRISAGETHGFFTCGWFSFKTII